MPSPQTILLACVAAAATAQAEHLRVVWSSGTFSTIAPPGGSGEHGYDSGFVILNDDDEAIYSSSYPYDYSPCFQYDEGRIFGIDGDCWDTQFNFQCKAGNLGNPESCSVRTTDGEVLASGEGQQDTTFIGIAIGTDSSCVVEFDSNGDGCPVYDPDNEALSALGRDA